MSEALKLNPFASLGEQSDPSVPTATLQIYEFINSYLERPADTHINRASAATLCHKRRWYQRKGFPGQAMAPRAQVNFLQGDLAERTLLYFITQACVGPGKLYSEVDLGERLGAIHFQGKELVLYKQQDLTAEIAGYTQTAHVDGWGKRNLDGEWELIECKSSSNYGFDDFKETGPKDYLKQAHVCLQTEKAKALGARSVRYFYLRKETGHLWDRLFSYDQGLADEVAGEIRAANGEAEPHAPHFLKDETYRGKPTGRRVAQFPCSYCPYLERCQGAHTVDFKGGKPIYVFATTTKGD